MCLVPGPRRFDNRVEIRKTWRPAEFAARFIRRGAQHRGVAGPPGRQRPRYFSPGNTLDRVDDLVYRIRLAGPEVIRRRPPGAAGHSFERQQMVRMPANNLTVVFTKSI